MSQPNPSLVVALFVTRFDATCGYELVWSRVADPAISVDGLEYLSLPSGTQHHQDTRIAIARTSNMNTYYGVCHFLRRVSGSHGSDSLHIDRKNVHMYAIGVLCAPNTSSLEWRPNSWTATGFEYLGSLEKVLLRFMSEHKWENYAIFEETYQQLSDSPKSLISAECNSDHFLSYFVDLLESCGPLIFVLYKQALLRRRILFFHNSETDFYPTNAFNYLIALLLVIPQAAHILDANGTPNVSCPVYNIGLHDVNSDLLKSDAYIATTSDDILLNHKNLYDVAVIMPNSTHPVISIISSHDQSPLRATRHDYTLFVRLASALGVGVTRGVKPTTSLTHLSKSDVESIHGYDTEFVKQSSVTDTSQSAGVESEISQSSESHQLLRQPSESVPSNSSRIAHVSLNNHPQWWDTLAEPIAWTDLLWRAFSWFASAGEPADLPEDSGLNTEDQPPPVVDTLLLINAIGSFHHQTRQYISVLNEIIMDTVAEHDQQGHARLDLNLSYLDLSEMGLDIQSRADAEFAIQLVHTYYSHIVSTVTVGYGICGVCS